MAKLIGMGGSITVGSGTFPVSEWSLNVSNDSQDVTDTGSNGWVATLAGVNSAELSFRAWWGSGPSVLSTAFAIGTSVTASLAIGSGSEAITGNFIVSGFTFTNNAKSTVEFQVTAKSNGAITFPTT
jgi:predicted secreted protein